jgi:uncharacterized tellurite resistance protein B-like protein
MLHKLRRWLQGPPPTPDAPPVELAAAVLLFDIAVADGRVDDRELAGIRRLLGTQFQLDASAVDALLEEARQRADEAVDMFRYARAACDGLAVARRRALLEGMWGVALADRELDRHEEGRLRKLGDLLGLSHREAVAARHAAQASSNG